MDNISFNSWLTSRMDFSAEDKRECFETAKTIVLYAQDVRLNGLLSIDDKIPAIKDRLLRKALQLAVDSTDPELLRESVQLHIVCNDYKGRRLLESLLIKHGVISIINGENPKQICDGLSTYFGDDFYREYFGYFNIENNEPVKQKPPQNTEINILKKPEDKLSDLQIQVMIKEIKTGELMLEKIIEGMSEHDRETFLQVCLYLRGIREEDIRKLISSKGEN